MITPILTKHRDDTAIYTIELRVNIGREGADSPFNPSQRCMII